MIKKRPLSLKVQMTVYLLIVMMVIAVFGQIVSSYFESQYSDKLLKVNADAVTRAAENIKSQYMALSDAIDSFAINKDVVRFLSSEDAYEKLTLLPTYENLLISYKKMNSGVAAIVLRRITGEIFSDAASSRLNIAITKPLFDAYNETRTAQLATDNGKAYVAMIRKAYQVGSKGVCVGNCMFVINAEILTDNIQLMSGTGQQFFVLDAEKRVIASNQKIQPGDELSEMYESYLTNTGEMKETQDASFIAVSKEVQNTGMSVLCLISREIIFSEIASIRRTTMLLLLLMIVLVATIYMIQNIRLSRSFRRFLNHMNDVAQGRATQQLVMNDSTEFQHLAQGFNDMLLRLNTLYENNMAYHNELLQKELENKQSQLLALQSQINPHFLYNTLECINSAGAVCGSHEVEEMSTALAYIFRYAIKGGNAVYIKDELETLHYYLSIQQIRFPGRFEVTYNIPEEVKEMQVLKFILQPIVENSISHGFKDCCPPCRINVSICRVENGLSLIISDNGAGMTDEALQELRLRLKTPGPDNASIGLPNIERRIRLYYGDAFGLSIDSTLGKGTTVTLNLPVCRNGG